MTCLKKYIAIFLFVLGYFSITSSTHNQPNGQEYKVQTLLIYNFTKYVKWSTASSEFVIVVYGNSPIISYFNQLKAAKQVNGKSIVVKTINPGDKLPTCDLLYIDDPYTKQAEAQFTKGSLHDVLVVTNTTPIPIRLSCINLKEIDDSYKFEINNTITSINNLEVSSALLNLAIKVYK